MVSLVSSVNSSGVDPFFYLSLSLSVYNNNYNSPFYNNCILFYFRTDLGLIEAK